MDGSTRVNTWAKEVVVPAAASFYSSRNKTGSDRSCGVRGINFSARTSLNAVANTGRSGVVNSVLIVEPSPLHWDGPRPKYAFVRTDHHVSNGRFRGSWRS
ncbi:Methylenetetrahydrofolate dehydrogenase (NADP(+)) [Anopheles sinensis]|uniref:Methylenetetrahydrofolate dehydrogenase (NADP(+)) n=1 Tax=Anopheles sinensis TaxID=74873 RepID=A0A084VGP6_ANOSI|nr:Methylenetetrahydrofolate dehydrogenase (NADP(+)) [Anopheles sinensis]